MDEFHEIAAMCGETLVPPDKLELLYRAALRAITTLPAKAVWYECGVYKGGSALLLAEVIRRSERPIPLRLFDTFCGMPFAGPLDTHQPGEFADTSLEAVAAKFVGYHDVRFHVGVMPYTFEKCSADVIGLAFLDVDQERSMRECLEFIWPRMIPGGIVVIDDYGWKNCQGVKPVVDEFFATRRREKMTVHPHFAIEVMKG